MRMTSNLLCFGSHHPYGLIPHYTTTTTTSSSLTCGFRASLPLGPPAPASLMTYESLPPQPNLAATGQRNHLGARVVDTPLMEEGGGRRG